MYYFSKLSLLEISSLLCMNMKRIYNKEEKKLNKYAEERKKCDKLYGTVNRNALRLCS